MLIFNILDLFHNFGLLNYEPHNRYLPFTQTELDRNPNLKQNEGY